VTNVTLLETNLSVEFDGEDVDLAAIRRVARTGRRSAWLRQR